MNLLLDVLFVGGLALGIGCIALGIYINVTTPTVPKRKHIQNELKEEQANIIRGCVTHKINQSVTLDGQALVHIQHIRQFRDLKEGHSYEFYVKDNQAKYVKGFNKAIDDVVFNTNAQYKQKANQSNQLFVVK